MVSGAERMTGSSTVTNRAVDGKNEKRKQKIRWQKQMGRVGARLKTLPLGYSVGCTREVIAARLILSHH